MTQKQFANIWNAIEHTPGEAENMRLRSSLMLALKDHITRTGLSQLQAAKLFGVTQPRISDLVRGKINLFAIDALVNMMAAAGLYVDVRIPDAAGHADTNTEAPWEESEQALYQEGRPLFLSRVQAGFPSPADDYVEGRLDLNKHLVKHPAATFFVRVAGDSMINAGIHPNDILVVDRSLEAADKRVVIAIIDGELTVKRLSKKDGAVCLVAENPQYPPIDITPHMEFEIWGVVSHVIHSL